MNITNSPSYAKEIIRFLKEAKARIEDPLYWTQGTMARDALGKVEKFSSPYAIRFCALGTLAKACWDDDVDTYYYDARAILDTAAKSLYNMSLEEINDAPHDSHEDCHDRVMKVYEVAITTAEQYAN